MSEYIVYFGNDGKSDVRMAMAKQHGAVVRGGIVRCKDCRHEGKPYECWLGETKPDEFCSRGKRKEGGDD